MVTYSIWDSTQGTHGTDTLLFGEGDSLYFNAYPPEGWNIYTFSNDSHANEYAGAPFHMIMPANNVHIDVTFTEWEVEAEYYNITLIYDPVKVFTLPHANNYSALNPSTFHLEIYAHSGYEITEVLLDGVSQGTTVNYTTVQNTENHIVEIFTDSRTDIIYQVFEANEDTNWQYTKSVTVTAGSVYDSVILTQANPVGYLVSGRITLDGVYMTDDGTFGVIETDFTTDSNVMSSANWSNWQARLINTNGSVIDGAFTFYINQFDSYTTPRYEGLKIIFTVGGVNGEKQIFLTFNPVYDDSNDVVFGVPYRIAGAIIVLCICAFGLTYLTRRYNPLAGLLVGLVIAIIINVYLELFDSWTIFVAILLIVLTIIFLLKGKG